MIISPNSGLDLHSGAFLLSLGLVILLVTYLIEDRITFSSNLLTIAAFVTGAMMTAFGIVVLLLCLAMQFVA